MADPRSLKYLPAENVPTPSVRFLREHGFHVESITFDMPGIADEIVLEKAKEECLVLITFDRDFGRLIFADHLPPP